MRRGKRAKLANRREKEYIGNTWEIQSFYEFFFILSTSLFFFRITTRTSGKKLSLLRSSPTFLMRDTIYESPVMVPWARKSAVDDTQKKLVFSLGEGTAQTAREFWWPWESSSGVGGVLKYTVGIPDLVDVRGVAEKLIVTDKLPFARGQSKCCYKGTIGGQACAILIEPVDVPTLNEDVNYTIFEKNSTRREGPFRDATPTTNNKVIEHQQIMKEITATEPNLLPRLHFMGVCTGAVDNDSLRENYPKKIKEAVQRLMKGEYRAERHGPDALKATRFAVEISEKYEISLENYIQTKRPPSEVTKILTKIAILRTRLHMRGFDHDDLHTGNIVINPGAEPMVRFIDLGLTKARTFIKDLYTEYILGTELARHVSMAAIIQEAMEGGQTADDDSVLDLNNFEKAL